MIKKWNAVCSWMLTLFLLGHMLTMSIPVLTGGQDYSDCQILAGGIVATVLIHVVLIQDVEYLIFTDTGKRIGD